MNNPYDQIPYSSYPFPQTHPDRLATMATLFGMHPVPITGCRVLEVGCGDGSNLIPMALGFPGSTFVGFDLAQKPIDQGQAMINELGLKNIELRQADLMEFDDQERKFDYIIVHGLYAWVPPEVQDGLMALLKRLLSPNGIAYVSYNAYPGCHLREMTREMMLFHTRGKDEPYERMNQGLSLLKFILAKYASESEAREDLYGAVVFEQFDMLSRHRHREQVYHDHLAPFYRPSYFFQFAGHAAQHGLQYLGEAAFSDMQDFQFPDPVRELLAQFDDQHIVAREQYLDFLKGRSFRQTLLCHEGIPLDRTVTAGQIESFYFASEMESVSSRPDLANGVVEEFKGPKGAQLKTDFPLAKAALVELKEAWPRLLSWKELVEAAGLRVAKQRGETITHDEVSTLGEVILAAYRSGVIELYIHQPVIQLEVTELPIASPLARLQAQRGQIVTNLLHTSVILQDELSRQLLTLMDGTRSRTTLQQDLQKAMQELLPLKLEDGMEIGDPEALEKHVADLFDANLLKAAGLALLVG